MTWEQELTLIGISIKLSMHVVVVVDSNHFRVMSMAPLSGSNRVRMLESFSVNVIIMLGVEIQAFNRTFISTCLSFRVEGSVNPPIGS